MSFWEVVGVIVAGLVGLNSAIDAVRGVTLAPVRIYRWIRNAIHAVDVITAIPGRLTKTEDLLAEHIAQAKPQSRLLIEMAEELGGLAPLVKDVHHEVKNNGGSSLKDSAHRIERAMGLPEPTHHLPTGPVRVA